MDETTSRPLGHRAWLPEFAAALTGGRIDSDAGDKVLGGSAGDGWPGADGANSLNSENRGHSEQSGGSLENIPGLGILANLLKIRPDQQAGGRAFTTQTPARYRRRHASVAIPVERSAGDVLSFPGSAGSITENNEPASSKIRPFAQAGRGEETNDVREMFAAAVGGEGVFGEADTPRDVIWLVKAESAWENVPVTAKRECLGNVLYAMAARFPDVGYCQVNTVTIVTCCATCPWVDEVRTRNHSNFVVRLSHARNSLLRTPPARSPCAHLAFDCNRTTRALSSQGNGPFISHADEVLLH